MTNSRTMRQVSERIAIKIPKLRPIHYTQGNNPVIAIPWFWATETGFHGEKSNRNNRVLRFGLICRRISSSYMAAWNVLQRCKAFERSANGTYDLPQLATGCVVTVVQSEKKSLSVAVTNEFYHHRFAVKKLPQNWLWTLRSKLFFFFLYSTHHEGKTFPRSHSSRSNSFLEKWQKFLNLTLWTRTC